MKRISINIRYNGEDFLSNPKEYADDEVESIEYLLSSAASGKLAFLNIRSSNKDLYIPCKILEQSIISLVYQN